MGLSTTNFGKLEEALLKKLKEKVNDPEWKIVKIYYIEVLKILRYINNKLRSTNGN